MPKHNLKRGSLVKVNHGKCFGSLNDVITEHTIKCVTKHHYVINDGHRFNRDDLEHECDSDIKLIVCDKSKDDEIKELKKRIAVLEAELKHEHELNDL